jgi:hypothetical protein
MSKSDFLVIGDSHSLFFNITPDDRIHFPELENFNFHVHYLGPVLAKSLTQNSSTLMGRQKTLEILNGNKHIKNVVFSFGEIDCRFHTIARLKCDRNIAFNDTVLNSIKATVLRYASFLYEVRTLGFNTFTWGPVATNQHVVERPDQPNYGDMQTRNKRYQVFQEELRKVIEPSNVLTIFPHLITEDLHSKAEFYFDEVHLIRDAWKFALPVFQKL